MNSLKVKIGTGYLLIIILTIALAAFSLYHINDFNNSMDIILKENYRNICGLLFSKQLNQKWIIIPFVTNCGGRPMSGINPHLIR
jgi:hypothetical protein